MDDRLPREAAAGEARRETHTAGGRSLGVKGQTNAEDGAERGSDDEGVRVGSRVGVGGAQEAERGDRRGGVASGDGASANSPGAMGAAGPGTDGVEHLGQEADHQAPAGFEEGGALQEGPGKHPQVERSGQGNEAGGFGRGAAWHGLGGHHDDPNDGSAGVAECEQVERVAVGRWGGPARDLLPNTSVPFS